MSKQEELEKLADGLADKEWEELRVEELLGRSERCPYRETTPEGVRYCLVSLMFKDRCEHAIPETVSLACESSGFSPGGMKSKSMREILSFHQEVASLNICSYRLPGEEETKRPLIV